MNRHSRACLRSAVILALLLTYLGQETVALAAEGPFTARIVLSRRRVHPGETVKFGLELIDSEGQSQRIPDSARPGQPPQITLYNSQGQQIGTYSLRYG